MKKLFITLTLVILFFPLLCLAQEAVVFHFNFTFEQNYNYTNPNKWILTEEVEKIVIKVLNSKKQLKWERTYLKYDLLKDQNGYCLFSDTVNNLKNSVKTYRLKVNYQLASGIDDSCEMSFSYPDSVKKLALELYFDQALISSVTKDSIYDTNWEEYKVDPNPKPVLIVKYLDSPKGIFLSPTWFDYYRLTKRAEYILYNNSTDTLFKADRGMLTCFFGHVQILDSLQKWVPYVFGGICGTFGCNDPILPGQTYDIVEAYPTGDPQKFTHGYYKCSVDYKNSVGMKKTINTYFTVIYSN